MVRAMREHQPRWRVLILLLVLLATAIAIPIYLALGLVDLAGVWVAFTKVSVVGFLTWALWELFRRRLWRWRAFRGWLVDVPDLNGSWLGVARSSYAQSSDGEPNDEIQVSVQITQTFTSISVAFHALTLTSDSHSVTASLITDPEARRCRLVYTYLNEPSALANDLDMHFGTAILEICGEPPAEMKGHYMTDRKEQTKGALKLRRDAGEAA